MKRSLLFLADGFEEIEALATVDIMRRAGMDVKTVSIKNELTVTGAHGVTVIADAIISETDLTDAEWLILPGGMPGATNLSECEPLNEALKAQAVSGKIAAICASPAVVLAPLGILNGKEATCYPGFEAQCENAIMTGDQVVALENLITANGPAAAARFALAIVANSMGNSVAKQVSDGMLY